MRWPPAATCAQEGPCADSFFGSALAPWAPRSYNAADARELTRKGGLINGSEPARRIGSAVAFALAEATANPNARDLGSLRPGGRRFPAGLVAPPEDKPKGAADARDR